MQPIRRTTPTPLILDQCTTERFIRFVMHNHQPPTTIIICSSRESFIQDFLAELHPPIHRDIQEDDEVDSVPSRVPLDRNLDPTISPLLIPTLNLLAASRSITVAFCPELTHLLAYLFKQSISSPTSSLTTSEANQSSQTRPILAILDPIRLHKPTSSFSAQGFNRTFAAAVETAHHLGQQLMLAECVPPGSVPQSDLTTVEDETTDETGDGGERNARIASPWDEDLSMLNVTTKTFGAGERGWVGRTVRIRQVAERWCESVVLGDNDQG